MTHGFVRGALFLSALVCTAAIGCNKAAEEAPTASANAGAPAAAEPAPAGGPAVAKNEVNHVSADGVRTVTKVELPNPVILMKTSLGDIYLRLNQKAAPRTVSNFVDYVITRHYDGTIFHQINGGYVVLGGTFDEKLKPKTVRYPIPNEAANGLKNKRGTIAMSRNPADPNSATSQFFINLSDNPKLDRAGDKPEDAGFCVFGEVVEGLDVLEKIAQVQTASVKGFEKLPVQTVSVQTMKLMR
ncbi:MAG: peptidylprolyl isomerase [Planctomycetia bacterium]|nr:peptidylprolyl isomerase [Planctomycetia bacterium]